MHVVITLAEARRKGLKRYFTGKPCKHGHIAERYTETNRCFECNKVSSRKDYKQHKSKRLASVLAYQNGRQKFKADYDFTRNLRKYGLTYAMFEAMLVDQTGHCKICGDPFYEGPYVDHCHTGGHVRGLLCNQCNTGLGMFRDNPEYLAQAISYLRSASPKSDGLSQPTGPACPRSG